MLVEIDYDSVSEWAQSQGIAYTDYVSLATNLRVSALISEAIDEANSHLARVEQVKKFSIIPRELDPEYGDTTPTRKIKRVHFYTMFSDLIEAMYVEAQEGLSRIEQEVMLHYEEGENYA